MFDKSIKSILIIGSGPIVIGQACEFDYSGSQAAKALKNEGYRVILVNSNPATIMTDPSMADATYIEPLTAKFLKKIIEKEIGFKANNQFEFNTLISNLIKRKEKILPNLFKNTYAYSENFKWEKIFKKTLNM